MTTNKQIKVGVSGDKGSFSEMAAKSYADKKRIKAEIAYLIDMEGVLSALEQKKIDIGVFPVSNSVGGLVREAFVAMGRYPFHLIDEMKLKVRHCLLALPGQNIKKVKKIYSYSQAFVQCEKYLKKHFPASKQVYWGDTAKAARDLSLGKLPKGSAAIAPKETAKLYNLRILRQNIQDLKENLTTFIIVER